jgi:hypothetical protein
MTFTLVQDFSVHGDPTVTVYFENGDKMLVESSPLGFGVATAKARRRVGEVVLMTDIARGTVTDFGYLTIPVSESEVQA